MSSNPSIQSSGSGDLALRATGLGKQYRLGEHVRSFTLRDRFSEVFRRRPSSPPQLLWALKDVSFDLKRGEALGIIGGNGAGKSTLLKILSRITMPTAGRAELWGRVGSLLEVGTGFHPDLTGRENIHLNAVLLGMRRAELRRRFDAIVEFAEIAAFLDTPVKHYSSGMYMRLAFAVAAHLETEILLVDEVLAVGDLAFQRKCLGKMDDLTGSGRTVCFVSHNMDAVQRLCSRGVLLKKGEVATEGPISEVVASYRNMIATDAGLGRFVRDRAVRNGWARISDIRLLSGERAVGRRASDDPLVFEVDVETAGGPHASDTLRGLVVELVVHAEEGYPIFSVMNVDDGGVELPRSSTCTLRVELAPPTLVPGRYRLFACLGLPYLEHVDELHDCFEFEITPPERPWRPYPLHAMRGRTCRRGEWALVDHRCATL
jgi:lipopolysaccharide transport system ATP-binding protein